MNRVEKYIPKIIEILNNDYPNGQIPKVYNSYISSFATSVAMNGLIATIALYEDMNKKDNERTKDDKSYITYLIMKVLTDKKDSLLRYVLEGNEKQLKQKILDISIAFKLAIRTFKLEE